MVFDYWGGVIYLGRARLGDPSTPCDISWGDRVVIWWLGWAAASTMAFVSYLAPWLEWSEAWARLQLQRDCDGSTVALGSLDFLQSGLLPRKQGSRRPTWKLKAAYDLASEVPECYFCTVYWPSKSLTQGQNNQGEREHRPDLWVGGVAKNLWLSVSPLHLKRGGTYYLPPSFTM